MNAKNLVIYNPFAGRKRKWLLKPGPFSLQQLRRAFKRVGIGADFVETTCARHLKDALTNASRYSRIIVAGGDGTLNRVINDLSEHEIPLAYLPFGTIMNARMRLDLPDTLEACVETIGKGTIKYMHVGHAQSLLDPKKRFLFLDTMGCGFDAQLLQYLYQEKQDIKIPLSFRPASFTIFSMARRHQCFSPQVFLSLLDFRNNSSSDDLRLYYFTSSVRNLVGYYYRRLFHRNYSSPYFVEVLGDEFVIKSRPQVPIHLDGQVMMKTPVKVTLLRDHIPFIIRS